MWRGAILLLVCTLWSGQVRAGPWPREKGEVFTAVTGTYRIAPNTGRYESEGSFYLEYGLTRRLTAGLDVNDTQSDYTHAYAFLRWPVSKPGAPLKFAISAGAGASRRDGDWGSMARLAFEAGRSINLGRSGWWNVTVAAEDHSLWDAPTFKIDTTLGVNLSARLKGIIDLETNHRRGSANTVTVRTSLVWKQRGPNHLIVGLEAKDADIRSYGMRVGLWRSF